VLQLQRQTFPVARDHAIQCEEARLYRAQRDGRLLEQLAHASGVYTYETVYDFVLLCIEVNDAPKVVYATQDDRFIELEQRADRRVSSELAALEIPRPALAHVLCELARVGRAVEVVPQNKAEVFVPFKCVHHSTRSMGMVRDGASTTRTTSPRASDAALTRRSRVISILMCTKV
jgi:hypothetical protein